MKVYTFTQMYGPVYWILRPEMGDEVVTYNPLAGEYRAYVHLVRKKITINIIN
jgi:hypothetical protein